MIENEIAIDSDGNRLSGTVCLPDDHRRFPLVLMVHGSGPLDRDENMKGQRLDVFNTIAHCLAREGIASLRYDKRGCGRSSGDYYAAGIADLVNDAVRWFDALSQRTFVTADRIFALGHSEGCIIVPQVSLRRPAVAGLILLCPFVDAMESVLIKQAEQFQRDFDALTGIGGLIHRVQCAILGKPVTRQRKLIEQLKTAGNLTAMRSGFTRIPARALRELIDLDPRAVFQDVTSPMLVVGGEKDVQCDPADVGRIAGLVKGPVSAHVVRNMTHILRCDERQPSFLHMGELTTKPVEPIILHLIEEWLKRHADGGNDN